MSEPYPDEIRRHAGDDAVPGVRAPGAPVDPEETARGGGAGTGLVVAAPAEPGEEVREQIVAGTAGRPAAPGREEEQGQVTEG